MVEIIVLLCIYALVLLFVGVLAVLVIIEDRRNADRPTLGRYIDCPPNSHANQKPGWYCSRSPDHEGPCALWPL